MVLIKREEDYKDEKREYKDLLTSYINSIYIRYNKTELDILSTIVKYIQPKLDKYKCKLIFKGGNVNRLISNNVLSGLPYEIADKIKNDFSDFLKFSDNDFTVYIPDDNFEKYYNNVLFDIFEGLIELQNEVLLPMSKGEKNLPIELNNFDTNPPDWKKLERYSQAIEFNTPKKEYIKVSDLEFIPKGVFYSNINDALEFGDVRFGLCRTKINFYNQNLGIDAQGEFIDISVPYKGYDGFPENYKKFMRENVKVLRIEGNGKNDSVELPCVNINYLINDLTRMMSKDRTFPWEDRKWKKRLARLLLFIFLYNIMRAFNDVKGRGPSLRILKDLKKYYSDDEYNKEQLKKIEKKIYFSDKIDKVIERVYLSLQTPKYAENAKKYLDEYIKLSTKLYDISSELYEFYKDKNRLSILDKPIII